MKNKGYVMGLLMGITSIAGILLTNIIIPQWPDSKGLMLLTVAFFLLFFMWAGFWEFQQHGKLKQSILSGTYCAIIGLTLMMIGYFVIDNVFLDIVKQQPDKIWGLAHSNLGTMRAYVNDGLIRGTFFILPLGAIMGTFMGWLGAMLALFLKRIKGFKSTRFYWTVTKRWVTMMVVVTLAASFVYGGIQQVLRQSVNDPQIQAARDMAVDLGNGADMATVIPPNTVDITKSLAAHVSIYNDQGKLVASSAVLDGVAPEVPSGVLDYTRQNGEDRVTWQPKTGVRQALVVERISGPKQTGFVAVGRSMSEQEKRIDDLGKKMLLGWLLSLMVTLATSVVLGIADQL